METIAKFEIPKYNYLDPKGKPIGKLPDFADDKDIVCDLYSKMVLLYTLDKKAFAKNRGGDLGTYPLSRGQEAVCPIFGYAMQPEDVHVPYYRDIGAQLVRGVSIEEVMAYWFGDERGNDYKNPAVKDDFPTCVTISAQCLHATGVARAFQIKKEKRVAVTCIGEGGTSEGEFYEAINLAGAWNLPVVFVVNNNQWAISVPLEAQTACQTIAQKGIAGGIDCVQVDGFDAIAMYEQSKLAIERARNGQGPTIIEAINYRYCDHTTVDNATNYRNQELVERQEKFDPLVRMKQYLMDKGFWTEEQDKALHEEHKETVNAGVKRFLDWEPQAPEAMLEYLYEHLPEPFMEQYEELCQMADGGEE